MRTVDLSTLPETDVVDTWAPWAERQGLDSHKIPLESVIEIDDENRTIAFDEFQFGADGKRVLADSKDRFARARRSVQLDRPVEAFPQAV